MIQVSQVEDAGVIDSVFPAFRGGSGSQVYHGFTPVNTVLTGDSGNAVTFSSGEVHLDFIVFLQHGNIKAGSVLSAQ